MRYVLDLVYVLTALALSPMAIYRAVRHNRYRKGWAQRLGKIDRKDPTKKCIWLHAVSVGEVNAATTLIAELEKRFTDYEIVISTTTDTGFARAQHLFGDKHLVFYFTYDFSWAIRRAFSNIRPSLCVLIELEVWPNFMHFAEKADVPVIVVNGRISDRGFARYMKIRPIAKAIFAKVTLVLAQTEQYAERFIALGCPPERVIVTGSLKYDTAQIADTVEGTDTLAAHLFGELKTQNPKLKTCLWVAGGTGDNEEAMLLDVYRALRQDERFADLRLAIVPRKPERFDEVADLITQKGFDLTRYSDLKNSHGKLKIENRKSKIDAVFLGDTMGDLRKFYSLASVIFVGRSLVPMGGSDMMEAAALGKCTIFGPHAFNFQQTVDDLLANDGAIMVRDKNDLLDALKKCLLDRAYAERVARSGREVIRENQGATAKTIQHIVRILTAV
jgi:3-deoxy-D-manno-octulosonic-acid transferase